MGCVSGTQCGSDNSGLQHWVLSLGARPHGRDLQVAAALQRCKC